MVSVNSAVLYCNMLSRIVWAWVTDLAVTACKTFAAVMRSQLQWVLNSRPSWNSLKQWKHKIISLLWPGYKRQLTTNNPVRKWAQFSFKAKIFVDIHFFRVALETDWMSLTLISQNRCSRFQCSAIHNPKDPRSLSNFCMHCITNQE